MNRLRRACLFAAPAALVSACAPVRRSDIIDSAGSETTDPMLTLGTITGAGSALVNGFEWNTAGARILVNGKASAADALRPGMVVRVAGTRAAPNAARGTAQTLQYDADLVGPMQRDSISHRGVPVLKIAGQPFFADTATRFDGCSALNELLHNDLLEASGYRDRAGALHATWIKRIGGIELLSSEVRIKGWVSEAKAAQFKIGDLVVLSQAHQVKNGDFVAVTGKWRVAAPELAANRVQTLSAAVDLPQSVPVRMEGLIRAVSPAGFAMHNWPVAIRSGTTFENGHARDLREDRKVQVEGELKAGVFDAVRIRIPASSE